MGEWKKGGGCTGRTTEIERGCAARTLGRRMRGVDRMVACPNSRGLTFLGVYLASVRDRYPHRFGTWPPMPPKSPTVRISCLLANTKECCLVTFRDLIGREGELFVGSAVSGRWWQGMLFGRRQMSGAGLAGVENMSFFVKRKGPTWIRRGRGGTCHMWRN